MLSRGYLTEPPEGATVPQDMRDWEGNHSLLPVAVPKLSGGFPNQLEIDSSEAQENRVTSHEVDS